MHNVSYDVTDSLLTIRIDVSSGMLKKAPPSTTGKTSLVATTSGALPIDGIPGLSLSLNLMAKKPSA